VGIELFVRRPVVAWSLATGTLWAWHLPVLYNAALRSESVHIAQHLLFLATASIFWWPVFCPLEERRLPPPGAAAYLFAAASAGSLLGIYFTFAPPGLYPAYLHLQPQGDPAVLHVLRDEWGLTPAPDQQLGGLIMWVPGGLVYLGAIMGAFARWHSAPDEEDGRVQGTSLVPGEET
jgi:cytochrome c oxidase assembly factor CtaG